MRDFDTERSKRLAEDRAFKIGGEQFEYRAAVAPEMLMRWSELSGSTDRQQAALNAAKARLNAVVARGEANKDALAASPVENADHQLEVANLAAAIAQAEEELETAKRPESEWLDVIDETILAIIEPSYRDIWHAIRDPQLAFPLDLPTMQELMEWLIEKVVNRPTGQPSASPSLPLGTETRLTVDSSSPADREASPILTSVSSAT